MAAKKKHSYVLTDVNDRKRDPIYSLERDDGKKLKVGYSRMVKLVGPQVMAKWIAWAKRVTGAGDFT